MQRRFNTRPTALKHRDVHQWRSRARQHEHGDTLRGAIHVHVVVDAFGAYARMYRRRADHVTNRRSGQRCEHLGIDQHTAALSFFCAEHLAQRRFVLRQRRGAGGAI